MASHPVSADFLREIMSTSSTADGRIEWVMDGQPDVTALFEITSGKAVFAVEESGMGAVIEGGGVLDGEALMVDDHNLDAFKQFCEFLRVPGVRRT